MVCACACAGPTRAQTRGASARAGAGTAVRGYIRHPCAPTSMVTHCARTNARCSGAGVQPTATQQCRSGSGGVCCSSAAHRTPTAAIHSAVGKGSHACVRARGKQRMSRLPSPTSAHANRASDCAGHVATTLAWRLLSTPFSTPRTRRARPVTRYQHASRCVMYESVVGGVQLRVVGALRGYECAWARVRN